MKLARTGGYRKPVGCVKAMWRYATRRASKQKRRLLRIPGYYQYSNEIACDLITGAGLPLKRIQRALAHIIIISCCNLCMECTCVCGACVLSVVVTYVECMYLPVWVSVCYLLL